METFTSSSDNLKKGGRPTKKRYSPTENSKYKHTYRVLVVDDEKDIVETIVKMIQLNGYYCDGAFNGEEALQLFRRRSYDLVVSDIRMGPIDGVELFKTIRQTHPKIPFIFISGFKQSPEIEAIVKEANGYFQKPFSLRDLLDCIKKLLSN